MVNGVIMASGFGRRMGKNKLMLPYSGKPIIEHVIEAAKNSDLNEIILIAREKEIIEIGYRHELKTVTNNNARIGQSESIKLGIENLTSKGGYMFLTGDQPLINSDIINLLISKFHENTEKIIVPLCFGKRSSPVTFPHDLRNELLELEGDTGGRNVINKHMDRTIYVTLEKGELLLDIDTHEDYIKILNNIGMI